MNLENRESIETKSKQKWYLKWWSVFALLFIFGPFALPALWKSRDFNIFWKWSITISVMGITVWIVWYTWVISKTVLDSFKAAGLY
ncbi:MAG: hypothetical protein A3G33_05735 [Omnitrophica bacterium RIFCSPLOWO2_12_FULL_44_17]|uniref:Uncharacterized protein n=1 Tax=Candidatus Danuiimicrobium aquiferis TaxID=1801832 RepID=A0A1G1L360_9BACT|nr:MAG: hypothetical protein A3B72_05215 [Omnitrophica bacterium RIFCSPHIGHO2_02_FULL_45_28]OGW99572.1 MAG: hypothetical protein A3G33_05735 [Omnitrophica bacterium RIFCSPLOWO2_12_FULL_44_17]OGX04020.1 MAG: hypothetical protein A3J12_06275 [Omnitrophica bacterium RIFCSPLOWO2_02_FULL_44_11]